MATNQLEALRNCAAAKVLAEPVVVTTNGREASVFSGGEFPILIPQPDGSTGVEHMECGVRLTTTPQILEDGRLRLDIASDISERDFQNAEVVDGHKVPGIIRRRFNAQVVMRFGETLVIGGLSRQHQIPSSVAQMLQKLPYQNRLFRPVSGTASEGVEASGRSMVVFVTAEPVTTSVTPPAH
jgi:pilus assembly protein CpaC